MSPKQEMYGMARLERAIARGPSDAISVLERTVLDCQKHVGNAPQFDDTTVVCLY